MFYFKNHNDIYLDVYKRPHQHYNWCKKEAFGTLVNSAEPGAAPLLTLTRVYNENKQQGGGRLCEPTG